MKAQKEEKRILAEITEVEDFVKANIKGELLGIWVANHPASIGILTILVYQNKDIYFVSVHKSEDDTKYKFFTTSRKCHEELKANKKIIVYDVDHFKGKRQYSYNYINQKGNLDF